MADDYWRRQPHLHPSAIMPKRPPADSVDHLPAGGLSSQQTQYFWPQDEGRAAFAVMKETNSVGGSYDHYPQNTQMPSFRSGQASNYTGGGLGGGVGSATGCLGGGTYGSSFGDSVMMGGPTPRSVGLTKAADGRGFMSLGGQFPADPMVWPVPAGREMPLPLDASNTVFVEGLPPDSTQREVGHIFRPFFGYKEVRLVSKEPKYNARDPLVLCFVDFENASYAMAALNALQGYKMDAHDPDSPELRLQFARNPGPRSGPSSRGERNPAPRSAPRSRGKRNPGPRSGERSRSKR